MFDGHSQTVSQPLSCVDCSKAAPAQNSSNSVKILSCQNYPGRPQLQSYVYLPVQWFKVPFFHVVFSFIWMFVWSGQWRSVRITFHLALSSWWWFEQLSSVELNGAQWSTVEHSGAQWSTVELWRTVRFGCWKATDCADRATVWALSWVREKCVTCSETQRHSLLLTVNCR